MEQMRKAQKTVRDVFIDIPLGMPLTPENLRMLGFPSVPHPYHGQPTATVAQCQKLNDICADHFTDEDGNPCYGYIDKIYFFRTEDDAHLFRSLILMV